jgi:hypothetical protein
MIARHTFKIHALCPLVSHKQWDYYEVTVQTDELIDVHAIESVMDSVRGLRATQEEIATVISEQLPHSALVEIFGSHSQNSESIVGCRGNA